MNEKKRTAGRLDALLDAPALLLLLELQEQLFEALQGLAGVRASRVQEDTCSTIQICAEHFEDAVCRKLFFPLSDGDLGIE